MKKEFIGNGAHWKVYRIIYLESEITKSIVFKEPLRNQEIDINISNYKLIISGKLPTLSVYTKKL